MKDTWLDLLVESTKYGESPARYYWWAGLAAISAVVSKRVFLDRHFYHLYPNIYVLLISAKSGLRKGVPVAAVNKLLKISQGARVISGQGSIQGFIKELGQQYTLENGQVISDAQAIITSGELGSAMLEDRSAWTQMTELYNTHEHEDGWKKRLANSAEVVLKNPCLSFLAASNEILFEDAIKSKDIEGGFIARTFIVHESKRRGVNSLVDKPTGMIPAENLAEHLINIKAVRGEFKWEKEGGEYYNHWYNELCSHDFDDRTGTLERYGDSVLKVAMLIGLARFKEYNELVLTKEIIESAIENSDPCVLGARKISMSQGPSELASATGKVLKILIEAPSNEITRKKLLAKLWPEIDSMGLERVVETLKISGGIDEPERRGHDIVYRMNAERLREYKDYRRGNT